MPHDSVINLDNTAPVRKFELTEPITELGPAKLDEVCRALGLATSCAS